jgi:hypothetical protein
MTSLLGSGRILGIDRYELQARVRPCFLTLAPFLIVAFGWFPEVRTIVGTVFSLLVSCGGIYLLSRHAQTIGHRLERDGSATIGRDHSAKLLSHFDERIGPETKANYHAFLKTQGSPTKLRMPTRDEEAADPAMAMDCYGRAVRWLIERSREDAGKRLLLDANIAYGFSRNLLALKPLALTILVGALIGNGVWTAYVIKNTADPSPGIIIGLVLVLMLLAWLSIVNKTALIDASQTYGERLLSLCEFYAQASATKSQPRIRKIA